MKNFFTSYFATFNNDKFGKFGALLAGWLILPLIIIQFIWSVLTLNAAGAIKWFLIFLVVFIGGDMTKHWLFGDREETSAPAEKAAPKADSKPASEPKKKKPATSDSSDVDFKDIEKML